ncbi:MAG: DUF2461 domain-containing protein, partial [Robiginitalea sp.]
MQTPVIDKKVLRFLSELKANNNRDWFESHRDTYREARETMTVFCNALAQVFRAHDQILPPKHFRIYRDLRFSKDKTPYKPHFAASFAREGARLRGGYYLQICPGESFIACGFWQPNKEDLYRIRKELEADATAFRQVINSPSVKNSWGPLRGEGVKTAPRGFDQEHPDMDLIRRKQFIFVRSFTDKEVLDPGFLKAVDRSFQDIRPFFDLMSEILTTDL